MLLEDNGVIASVSIVETLKWITLVDILLADLNNLPASFSVFDQFASERRICKWEHISWVLIG